MKTRRRGHVAVPARPEDEWPQERQRRVTARKQLIVEFLEGESVAKLLFVVAPKLQNHELDQRVIAVHWVLRPAQRLLDGHLRRLKALVREQVLGSAEVHTLRVQLHSDDVTTGAKQRPSSCASRTRGSPLPQPSSTIIC